MPDLSISPAERRFLAEKDLNQFWLSRLKKRDPVARIGYALWSRNATDLREVIAQGDRSYWDNKGFAYWETMARSTVVNIAVGLEKAGYHLSVGAMRKKIKEVGLEVARQHAIFVQIDFKENIGQVPGLLSLKQIAKYHHIAFAQFGIPPDFFGGTWFGAVPDSVEFELYGHLYCHDCDTTL